MAVTSVFKTHGRISVKGFCFYIYIDFWTHDIAKILVASIFMFNTYDES